MQKKQRIKYLLAKACRANALGTTARYDDLKIIRTKYDKSSHGIGGTKALAMFYTGAKSS